MTGANPNPAGSTYGSSSTTAGGGSSATGTTDTSATGTGSTADDTSAQSGSGGKLPRTASDLPLLAAIGLLALAGALTVRSLARRNA
jgi:hypothetical protein